VSQIADLIELDRGKSMELLTKAGVQTPPEKVYSNPKDALELLSSFPEDGLVIKPYGNQSVAKTTLCYEPEVFEWAIKSFGAKDSIIVQWIQKGVEVSTEGWFNGRDWVPPFNHTFEEKRLFNGNKGPNTGCMGNVVWAPTAENRLIEEGIAKLGPFLRKVGYRGPIDLNTIVNERGVWALELTPRFGYDAIEALMEGLKQDVTDLLFETATGIAAEMKVTTDYMAAVRVSVKPWPHDKPKPSDKGQPILGVTPENLKHVYFSDAYLEGDRFYYAAGDGAVYKATAHGRTVKEATQRAYRTISNVKILDAQYRTDIGDRVQGDIAKLMTWGYV